MTEENEQRMERLFHDHYEQMYRFAFALLHDNEEARDVVSDVFSRLWDKQLVPDRAYLMRSVKNACINLIARKKRDERLKRLLPLSEEKLTEEEPSRLEERWQAAVDCTSLCHNIPKTMERQNQFRLYDEPGGKRDDE